MQLITPGFFAVSRLTWSALAIFGVAAATALSLLMASPIFGLDSRHAAIGQDYTGLYIATLPLIDSHRVPPEDIYEISGADGIYIRMVWNNIAPSPGQYDWSLLDYILDRAVNAKKKISLSVIAGGYAPEWLWEQSVSYASFVIGQGGGANRRCRTMKIGIPWDPGYQKAFLATIRSLGEHLHQKPGAYDAVKIVKLTGINQITEELRLPSSDGVARGVAEPCLADALPTWRDAGYQASAVVGAWRKIASEISDVFPDKVLATDILERNDFPQIGSDGEKIKVSTVKDEIIQQGIEMFGGRYAVQWNGLSAERVSTVVQEAGRAGAIIGWQTNAFRGREGAGCNARRNESPRSCDEKGYLSILENGIAAGGKYIEIWPSDALAFPEALDAAKAKLGGGARDTSARPQ